MMHTTTATETEYYAVIDRDRVTYWRRDKRGHIGEWPGRPYAPRRAIKDAIADDPDGCRARFAALTSRCCMCGRALTDPASKTYGIGPECRQGYPDHVLSALADRMGRVHAEALIGGESRESDVDG